MPKTKVSFAIAKVAWYLCILAMFAQSGSAQTYSVIHNFSGGTGGNYPYDGLTMDRAGNFYGTTYGGGSSGQGLVFKLSNNFRNKRLTIRPWYSRRVIKGFILL